MVVAKISLEYIQIHYKITESALKTVTKPANKMKMKEQDEYEGAR